MPQVNYQLASRQLNTGGSPGGLSPVLFSSAAASAGSIAATRAPQINPNVAHVNYSSVPIHEVTIDTTMNAAAQAAAVMSQSAIKYQHQEAQAAADVAVLDVESKVKEVMSQYSEQLGQAGSEGYTGFRAKITELTQGALEGHEPSVQAKMALRLKKIEDAYLTQGAHHKATQFKVWQGAIMQQQENQIIEDIIDSAGNPEAFAALTEVHKGSIAERYAGRDDFIALNQQAFVDKLFDTAIETHTRLGNFQVAGDLIMRGGTAGASELMLAKQLNKYETAIARANDEQIKRAKDQADLAKLAQESHAHNVINALEHETDMGKIEAGLASINDPEIRKNARSMLNGLREGVKSAPGAEDYMLSQRGLYSTNPAAVLQPGLFPGVSDNARKTFYNQLVADQKAGVTQLRTDANKWIDSLIPASITTFGSKAYNSQADTEKQTYRQLVNEALDDAVRNNKPPALAIAQAKQEILRTADYNSASKLQVQRGSLNRIKSPTSFDVSMLPQESKIMAIQDVEKREAKIQEEYILAGYRIASNYNLHGGALLDAEQFQQALAKINDYNALVNLQRDYLQLSMQKTYFDNLSRSASQQKSAADFNAYGFQGVQYD